MGGLFLLRCITQPSAASDVEGCGPGPNAAHAAAGVYQLEPVPGSYRAADCRHRHRPELGQSLALRLLSFGLAPVTARWPPALNGCKKRGVADDLYVSA